MPRPKLTDEQRAEAFERRRVWRRNYMRRYYAQHRDKRDAAVMKWRKRNKEKYLEYQRQYRERMKGQRNGKTV